MREYSVQVLNWIIVDWHRERVSCCLGQDEGGGMFMCWSLPASKEDGAFDAPFMLCVL